MNGQRVLLLVLTAMLLAGPARAGILFKKKPKVDPVQRVPELIGIVKSSPDESKRSEAAEELRKYDSQQFPEMIPTLLDVLQTDAKPSVRLSAMSTLMKYRPVSQEIGQAIEQALAKDASMRVRLQARKSLLEYHWAGYHSPKKDDPKPSKEPVLPTPLPSPQLPPPQPLPPVVTVPPTPIKTQPVAPSPPAPSTAPQRMPIGPPLNSSSSIKPAALPKLTPGTSPVKSDGPELGSPFSNVCAWSHSRGLSAARRA
jgi:hypothetical protein